MIATGFAPRRDGFQLAAPIAPVPGHEPGHVYTSWDVFGFGERADVPGPAVVFDDKGSLEAISVADVLFQQGVPVIVSRHEGIGATLPGAPARGPVWWPDHCARLRRWTARRRGWR